MTIDVRRLRVLREVALRGTIAAAAESLSYTPSAVSQQLSTFEREVGVALLERTGRGVRLTDEGRVLVRPPAAGFAELEKAGTALAATRVSVSGGGGGAGGSPGRRLGAGLRFPCRGVGGRAARRRRRPGGVGSAPPRLHQGSRGLPGSPTCERGVQSHRLHCIAPGQPTPPGG